MGIDLTDVYSGRSRFGITVAKVAAAKNVQAADQEVKRSKEVIQEEIIKVEKAQVDATKKIWKLNKEEMDEYLKKLKKE